MKTKILLALRESKGYISGQQLCEQFQVSRTAVWKVMEQLKKEGYKIEAVRNKGYYLADSPDIMSEAEIKSLIKTEWAGRQVLYFSETDSTNLRLKEIGDQPGGHGTLAVADMQTAGRGRRGRTWESPAGSSIYMSILLKPEIKPNQAPMLTLVTAQSVAEAIRQETGLDAKIKWPNDIVVNGRKICGILTEMSTEIDWINYVIIGVGINVNMESFPEELPSATSLRIEKGEKIGRAPLISKIMERFEAHYEAFIQCGDLSAMKEAYENLLVNKNQEVRVLEPGQEYEGRAQGINTTGELLVERENGQIETVYAGEVSVRGIYGYV